MSFILKNRKVPGFLFMTVYLLVLGVLIRSVVLSGYFYRLNADEVYHANLVYLILKGFRPYADFYSTYSPFLQLYLMPVFLIFGATVKAIAASRAMMIFLFLVQVVLWFLLVKRIFGKKTALIFVPLYLLDPFIVFAGMQIRPENLMMVFFVLFLLVFSYAAEYENRLKLFLISGIMFALTLLMNLKILPSLAGFGLVFIIYVFYRKAYRQLLAFSNGFCLTFFIFLGYFLISGYLPQMFQQLFIDPYTLNKSIINATWLGYFYFQNPVIFGLDGKPLNWIYAWLLPVLGFAGGYGMTVQNSISKVQKEEGKTLMIYILFLSLFLQWLSMLFITSVFIQYYIPLNWAYSIFTACLITHLVSRFKEPKLLSYAVVAVLGIFFFFLTTSSIKGNLARSKMSDDPIIKDMQDSWKIVPEDVKAFPSIPFRIPVYPVVWGGTFSAYIRDRYPPVYQAIEKNKLKILTGLNDEYFSFLDEASQQYILGKYQRDPENSRIWRKK